MGRGRRHRDGRAGWRGALACVLLAALAASAAAPLARPAPSRAASIARSDHGAGMDAAGLRAYVDAAGLLRVEGRSPALRLLPGPTGTHVELPGYGRLGREGEADLPARALLLAIPPSGTPRLSVFEEEVERIALDAPPAPFAPAAPRAPAAAAALGLPRALAPPRAEAGSPATGGTDAVGVEAIGWLRDQRVLRLRVAPVSYDPETGELRVLRRWRAELRFDDAAARGSDPGPRLAPRAAPVAPPRGAAAFEATADRALANPGRPIAWRGRAPAAAQPPAAEAPSESGPLWNLSVREEGMQRLTAAALHQAGLPPGTSPEQLRLFDEGEEVALHLDGAEDGRLDPGDALWFFGRASESRFTAVRVYQLALRDGPGLRMASDSRPPRGLGAPRERFTETLRVEADVRYDSLRPPPDPTLSPERDHDHFLWRQLSAPESFRHRATLPSPAPGPWTGTLRVALLGKTSDPAASPDHHARVSVGAELRAEARWDGDDRVEILEGRFSSDALLAGSLALDIEAPGGTEALYDQLYLDWIELDYARRLAARDGRLAFELAGEAGPARDLRVTGLSGEDPRAFDVSDARRPLRLEGVVAEEGPDAGLRLGGPGPTGGRLELGLAARFPSPRVEARPETELRAPAAGAELLIIAHADLAAAAAPLAEARRAEGLSTAIVDVQSVYDAFSGGTMSPAAIRAFLAHAASAWPEPRPSHVLLLGDGHYDPRDRLGDGAPILVPAYLDYVDPWLGEVASDNAYAAVLGDDALPDLFLGRIPARDAAQAAAAIAKILAQPAADPRAAWRRSLLFVADDPDNAGDFAALSDALADEAVPPGFQVRRVYHPSGGDAEQTRARVSAAMADGQLLAQYIGHGRNAAWGAEGLLRAEDMALVDNGGRLPLLLDMTCLTGYFAHPSLPAFAETALLLPEGGAIASFAPTGFGVASGHDWMNRGLLNALLRDGEAELGPLTLAAKLALYQGTLAYRDLLHTYMLFGDPSLRLVLPAADAPTPSPPPSQTPSRVPGPSPSPGTGTPAPGGAAFLPVTLRP